MPGPSRTGLGIKSEARCVIDAAEQHEALRCGPPNGRDGRVWHLRHEVSLVRGVADQSDREKKQELSGLPIRTQILLRRAIESLQKPATATRSERIAQVSQRVRHHYRSQCVREGGLRRGAADAAALERRQSRCQNRGEDDAPVGPRDDGYEFPP